MTKYKSLSTKYLNQSIPIYSLSAISVLFTILKHRLFKRLKKIPRIFESLNKQKQRGLCLKDKMKLG